MPSAKAMAFFLISKLGQKLEGTRRGVWGLAKRSSLLKVT